MASLDGDTSKKEDSDPRFGLSDGVSSVGFETIDKQTYAYGVAPFFELKELVVIL